MLKWVLLTIMLTPCMSIAKTQIIWISVSPTLSANTAQNNNDNPTDVTTSTLILKHMPAEYELAEVRGNNARMVRLLKSEDTVCAENKRLTEERKSLGYFTSIPQVVFPGLRLFITQNSPYYADIKALVKADGHISVSSILNTVPKAMFSIAAGRKYGASIDDLVANPKWQQRFIPRHGVDMSEGVVQMLRRERADMIFEYPSVVAYHESRSDAPAIIDSYALVESADYSLGYIICSKSKTGQKLIEHFNQSIKQLSVTRDYFNAHMQYFDPQSKKDATVYYNHIYGTQFK